MCWPVYFEDGKIIARNIPEGNPPRTGGFYWGWTFDSGPNNLEGRMVPQEKTIGMALDETILLVIAHSKWHGVWHGTHKLSLFLTIKHGILAARATDVQTI